MGRSPSGKQLMDQTAAETVARQSNIKQEAIAAVRKGVDDLGMSSAISDTATLNGSVCSHLCHIRRAGVPATELDIAQSLRLTEGHVGQAINRLNKALKELSPVYERTMTREIDDMTKIIDQKKSTKNYPE